MPVRAMRWGHAVCSPVRFPQGGTTVNETLSAEDLKDLKHRLKIRERDLIAELEAGEEKASERFQQIASEAPDAGDASVAHLAIDSASAERARDSAELREVREALARMEAGTYGFCIECGGLIPVERLRSIPWARYDVEHEARREAGVRTPTL
jgi:DnaK suppressor protein